MRRTAPGDPHAGRCPPACPLPAVSSVRVLASPPSMLRRRTTWRRRRRRRWAPAMWVCPPRPSLHSRARGQVSMFLATSGWQRPRRHCRHALNMLSQQHVCIPASFRHVPDHRTQTSRQTGSGPTSAGPVRSGTPASAARPGSGPPSWTCGRSRCLRRSASPPVPGQLHQRPRHAPGRRGRPRPGSLRARGRKSSQETPDSPRRLAPAAPGPGPLNRTDARARHPPPVRIPCGKPFWRRPHGPGGPARRPVARPPHPGMPPSAERSVPLTPKSHRAGLARSVAVRTWRPRPSSAPTAATRDHSPSSGGDGQLAPSGLRVSCWLTP